MGKKEAATPTQVRIPTGVLAALEEAAAKRGVSRHSEIISRLTASFALLDNAELSHGLGAIINLLLHRFGPFLNAATGVDRAMFLEMFKAAFETVIDGLATDKIKPPVPDAITNLGRVIGENLLADLRTVGADADKGPRDEIAETAAAGEAAKAMVLEKMRPLFENLEKAKKKIVGKKGKGD